MRSCAENKSAWHNLVGRVLLGRILLDILRIRFVWFCLVPEK